VKSLRKGWTFLFASCDNACNNHNKKETISSLRHRQCLIQNQIHKWKDNLKITLTTLPKIPHRIFCFAHSVINCFYSPENNQWDLRKSNNIKIRFYNSTTFSAVPSKQSATEKKIIKKVSHQECTYTKPWWKRLRPSFCHLLSCHRCIAVENPILKTSL
jgi:hypothetical protein